MSFPLVSAAFCHEYHTMSEQDCKGKLTLVERGLLLSGEGVRELLRGRHGTHLLQTLAHLASPLEDTVGLDADGLLG